MGPQRWLERVANELAGQGLPAGVRARLLGELKDHLEDLTDGRKDVVKESEMGGWMGDPSELAAIAAEKCNRVGWVQRHALLVFGLAPLPASIAIAALYILLVGGVAYAAAEAGFNVDSIPREAATTFTYGIGFVPFLAAAVMFGLLARAHVSRWWLVVALTQVAILGGLLTVQLNWSQLQGQSQLLLGVGLPFGGWRQAAQLLLPLMIGWFVVRTVRRPAILA